MRIRLILLAVIASCLTINAQEYRWGTDLLDGSMTGCTAASATNVEQALGMMDGDNYHAPSGKVYPGSSATSKVAALVLAAQPQMVDLKAVVAYTEEEMPHLKTEGTLSNWFVDIVTSKVSELVGTRMDVGICNLGGIRKGMPKGDVLLDDIQSMFPFKNYLVHLKMKGSELRKIFEFMATRKFEAISGATVEVTGGRSHLYLSVIVHWMTGRYIMSLRFPSCSMVVTGIIWRELPRKLMTWVYLFTMRLWSI